MLLLSQEGRVVSSADGGVPALALLQPVIRKGGEGEGRTLIPGSEDNLLPFGRVRIGADQVKQFQSAGVGSNRQKCRTSKRKGE
jgi:hypothetical protein